MKRRAVLAMAGAVVALTGMPQRTSAQPVSACTGNNCIQVSVTPSTQNASPGGVAHVGLMFKQAPNDSQAGGPDEIAALALTLSISGDASVPLQLNDCGLNADGLPNAVIPDALISNFKVVVENASCATGRTHCLCPDSGSGITPDNFINLVIYGPNPLPTPGPNPIDIPTLPAGPQQLLTIDLKAAGNASGNIPLHIYNQVQDSQHPPSTALLSVGDKVAVDQTCVPVAGQPPCSGSATSQVATTDASVTVIPGTPTCPVCGQSCTGDCDCSGDVTVNELISMVNIALGNQPVSACPAGDADCSGDITINEIIRAVGFALGSCPAS